MSSKNRVRCCFCGMPMHLITHEQEKLQLHLVVCSFIKPANLQRKVDFNPSGGTWSIYVIDSPVLIEVAKPPRGNFRVQLGSGASYHESFAKLYHSLEQLDLHE